jgi:hypothetical protein
MPRCQMGHAHNPRRMHVYPHSSLVGLGGVGVLVVMSRISPFLTPLLLDCIDLLCLALEERCRYPSLSGCHSVDHCIHHSTADPGHETL